MCVRICMFIQPRAKHYLICTLFKLRVNVFVHIQVTWGLFSVLYCLNIIEHKPVNITFCIMTHYWESYSGHHNRHV